ncbi:hypothetical protein PROFUN_11213 [Planoprotostelium fungivorum]|uniref:Uncharacterized protein n=1 Tax=Planoprotostelium fungivorum TaxID=1890364 RepID=A0A2P6NAY7_9EUKA|nr:hypothetical protein PROFUN_11213 [Planoprotostelium fungivorum]
MFVEKCRKYKSENAHDQPLLLDTRKNHVNSGRESSDFTSTKTGYLQTLPLSPTYMSSYIPQTSNAERTNLIERFKSTLASGGDMRGARVRSWKPGEQPITLSEKGMLLIQNELLQRVFPVVFIRRLKEVDVKTFPSFAHLDFEEVDVMLQEIEENVKKRQKEIIQDRINLAMAVDSAAEAHLEVASFVLAAYRSLTQRNVPHSDAVSILQRSIMENVQEYLAGIVYIHASIRRNPIPAVTSALEKSTRLRGRGFDVEFRGDTVYHGFLHVKVKKCLFHEFFNLNGSSYLTGMFCAAEKRMLEHIDVESKVTRTLANGDRECLFKIEKAEPSEETFFSPCC